MLIPDTTSVNDNISASISVARFSFQTLNVTAFPSVNPFPLPSSFDVGICPPDTNPSGGTVYTPTHKLPSNTPISSPASRSMLFQVDAFRINVIGEKGVPSHTD